MVRFAELREIVCRNAYPALRATNGSSHFDRKVLLTNVYAAGPNDCRYIRAVIDYDANIG